MKCPLVVHFQVPDNTSQRTGRLLAHGTINRIQEFVKATMNLVFELELIDKNPITNHYLETT